MRTRPYIDELVLQDKSIKPVAKYIYLAMQVIHSESLGDLARKAGVSRQAVSRAIKHLAANGWAKVIRQQRRQVPVPLVAKPVQERLARRLIDAFEAAPHKGEFLMKAWLDVLVASDDYLDNARPDFLMNPLTGDPLEFDRFYSAGVAFEFHGPQHYGPTPLYPGDEKFREAKLRDIIKLGLSAERGIVLVTVTLGDLSLSGMTAVIPQVLPRAEVDKEGPLVRTLEQLSNQYRARAARMDNLEKARALETRPSGGNPQRRLPTGK